MKLNFDLNNSVEKTEVVLGKKNYDKFGSLTNITDLTYDYNLMSAKSISFVVHKSLNNQDERLWNQIRDRRLIWVKEYDEWFEINVNIDEENEIKKEVTGTSLCEAELGQININSTEINTEDDIAREEYVNPTVFYKPSEPKESLLHRVLKKAPNYSIAYVDKSLWNIQRTFSFDGSSLYDVLTGEIAKEIGCLFLFNSSNRTISVYDLQTNCLECGYRGSFTDTCPECGGTNLDYGYGYDTSIFIDSENLAENITLTGKQDEVKNYIKVCGGDDVINTAISACNPTGTQYIFTFTKEDKEDMTEELSSKLDEYLKEYNRLTPDYKDIMGQIYDKLDEELKLESTMMPDITMAETDAKKELAKLVAKNLAPISVTDVSIASLPTVNNAVLSMAKCVVNSTVFKIEFIDGSTSFSSQTWKGKFRVTNNSDEEDTAENDNFITLKVDDDYANYVEQKVKKIINRNDKYLVDIFDSKTDFEVFKAELKKYCLKRLESFESAYASIIEVMTEAGVANESTYGDIYNDLYLPYYNKLKAIQEEISVREAELESVRKELEELDKLRTQITSYLNLENFLGGELWKELCAFRREDTYENSNYVSDGLSNNEVIEKAQELLNKARNELITTSTTQWSLSATLYNLLAMPEFSKLTGMFNGGNWIRIKIDDKIYRLRLVHYRLSDNDIQNLEVEFSDVTQTANGLNDINSLMSKVQSMATNFSAVVHQAEQGEKSFTELDKIRNDGLNTALYSISNSINQDFIIDEHGITGRMHDDILGTFAPEQVKINHNTIVWTDDYWQTAKCALGKIEYYNPILGTNIKQYGLLADAVIAGILMGNDIIGGDIYSENYSSTVGTHINLNNGDFSFAGGKLVYDSETNEITLKGVTLQWDDIEGLEDEFNKITDILNGNYTTTIGEDYVISPHIAGGYLYISDTKGSVLIDPKGIKNSDYIFNISNSSGDIVMGVDTSGNGIFEGKITSNSGKIGGWSLNSSSIYRTYSVFGVSGGMYFGTDGLSIGSSFKVTSEGTVTANGTFATGTSGTYAKLSDGKLSFYRNNTAYSSFGTGYWNGTTTYGTCMYSEVNSKFMSFGNKSSSSDTTYTTNFLINYGLNPNDRTEGVQVLGDFLTTGHAIIDGYIGIHNADKNSISVLGKTFVTDWDITALSINGNNSRNSSGLYVNGNIYCTGSLSCGGNKARTIQTETFGGVELYAYETTSPYFGDIGSGVCDENGLCYIYLDEIFKETVLNNYEYYIFIQKYGEESIYPIEKNPDYFVVKGTPFAKFDFEVKFRQKDTETIRLERTCVDIIEED